MADVQHKDLPDAQLHEPKGVVTATSGAAYLADGAGSGTWANVVPTNVTVVNSLTDFPAAVGGSITLAANTTYIIGANITSTDPFIVSDGTKITGGNWLSPKLTYSGTGTMFTGTDVSFLISDIRLDCPSAKVFNITDSVGATQSFEARAVIVDNCASFGTFSDMLFVGLVNSSSGNAGDGVDLSGSNFTLFSVRQFALTSTSSSFVGIDFGTSVHKTVEIRDTLFSAPASAVGISGAANNGNITSGFIATVESSTLTGGLTPLSGITEDDFRWKFFGNNGIRNTKADCMVALTNNATATTITTIDTPVKVAGTFVVERESHFTADTTGKVTYDGEVDIVVPVDISVTLDPAAGTNQDLRTYVALNGAVVANSGKTIKVDTGSPEGVSTPWQLLLQTGDFVEIFVENKSGTNNIIVKDAVLRVR